MRNYLKVTYKFSERKNGKRDIQYFTMKEVRLINTVVKELSSDGKCEVELIECTQDEYNALFV